MKLTIMALELTPRNEKLQSQCKTKTSSKDEQSKENIKTSLKNHGTESIQKPQFTKMQTT